MYFRKIPYLLCIVFLVILFSGCDRWLVKRIDLTRANNLPDTRIYEENKARILSIIDRIVLAYDMACKQEQDMLRFCTKNRNSDTLFAFEDMKGFTTCFVVLGTIVDDSEFVQFSNRLEKSISKSVTSTNLKISETDALPECIAPHSRP